MDNALLSISQAGQDQFVKTFITLYPHSIFRSNFSYLFMLTLFSHWYANSDEALLRIILAGQGVLVKMLITFEPHGLF